MSLYVLLIFNSIMLGVGLAMDAFSVSLANGFSEPDMKNKRMIFISGVYAFFQFIMPVIGWILVREAVNLLTGFQKFIPWIALILLSFIGIKTIIEGLQVKKCKNNGNCGHCKEENCKVAEKESFGRVTNKMLFMQGIATSIDALSVGFTISDYSVIMVIISAFIIGVTTHVLCFLGLNIGTKFGTRLAGNAKLVGGIILIGIGIEIFVKGILG